MYKAVHFTQIIPGSVKLNGYGQASVRVCGEKTGDIRGKTAYLPLDNKTKEPRKLIGLKDKSSEVWPKTGKTLYICKESHVPRTLIRNSDYKITINRENADYVVIPAVPEDEMSTRVFNIAYLIEGPRRNVLYYFILSFPWGHAEGKAEPEEVETIKKAIKDKFTVDDDETAYFFSFENLVLTTMYFLKNNQEIEDILTGEIHDAETDRDKYQIVLDTELRLEPTTNITLDTLEIWSKMTDRNMQAKAIIASDWQKYPCTTSVFIDKENLEYWGGEQMRYILRSIDHDTYRYNHTFKKTRIIEPDDWNLLQDWLMRIVGLKPEGGFKIQEGEGLAKFAHYAECFKPCKISEPTPFQEIMARLGNKS